MAISPALDAPPQESAESIPGRIAPPLLRPTTVPRARLLQRFSTDGQGGIVLLRAPAGYGKTTVLAQLAAQAREDVAWLSVEQQDEDPVALLRGVAHALAAVGSADQALVDRLQAGPNGVVTLALPRLMQVLGERTRPLLLILDDVHRLTSRGALDVLEALCRYAPATCTVVLAGRTAPGIATARLRAEGRLWDVTATDLRMTPSEGAAALRAAGAEIGDEEAAELVRRCEGWPAAIYLAGLGDGASGFSGGPDPEHLAAYLREEVLTAVPPQDADFLLRSSFLDELRPDVCDRALGIDDAAARLRALSQADVFVSRPDRAAERYRVHGLFREVLEHELRERHPDEARAMRRRATLAYRDLGDAERAVLHASASGDRELVSELIWQAAPRVITQGGSDTVVRWCGLLGDEVPPDLPGVALARGWAAYELGDSETAGHCVALALGRGPDERLRDGAGVRTMALLLRGTMGLQGREAARVDGVAVAADLDRAHPVWPVAAVLLGSLALLDGDVDEARAHLADAELAAAGRLHTVYAVALAQQTVLEIHRGRLDGATALTRRADAHQRASGVGSYFSQSLVSSARAWVLTHTGALPEAAAAAAQGARSLALARYGTPWLVDESRLLLAGAFAGLGDPVTGRSLLAEVDLDADAPGPVLTALAQRSRSSLGAAGAVGDGAGLTTAELRTLQYLPTHLSLREIGERLFISRNTVKTHTIAIYRKLGVTSRSEAVGRSRELGLLDG